MDGTNKEKETTHALAKPRFIKPRWEEWADDPDIAPYIERHEYIFQMEMRVLDISSGSLNQQNRTSIGNAPPVFEAAQAVDREIDKKKYCWVKWVKIGAPILSTFFVGITAVILYLTLQASKPDKEFVTKIVREELNIIASIKEARKIASEASKPPLPYQEK